MPSRTGSHSPAGIGKSLPERGLLLLMVLVLLQGSVLPLGAASSPDISHQENLDNHKVADERHNFTKKPFPVLALDYHHIQTPFEISLWVLLASLMKLGEYHMDVMLMLPAARNLSSAFPGNASSRLGYVAVPTGVVTAGKLAHLQRVVQMLNYLLIKTNKGRVCFIGLLFESKSNVEEKTGLNHGVLR